ncbi:hypothetical protein NRF22_03800 [Oenococcus kitaharae]|uniref:hypothetical protein n=1 Tax=Oenococcus TaxID=46254 RepID=UPI0021E7F7BB|nr:hypothetical protein [Oenococcus kitaharae]MCV3296237.1 hypothetical protein [Oenococcus kitaharae]
MTIKTSLQPNQNSSAFKRVKGNRKYFSQLLKGLMAKHNQEIKDLLAPVLHLYEGTSPLDNYQNGISKISNWRVGKTLPSNLELKALQDFYAKQGDHLTYFAMLYPDPLSSYLNRFFRDLQRAIEHEFFTIQREKSSSYRLLDQKFKSKDIRLLATRFDDLFSQDFSYMKATVSEYETDPETDQPLSEEELTNFFKEHILNKPRFSDGFDRYLVTQTFYSFKTLSNSLGSLINEHLLAYIGELITAANSHIQNELSQLYRNTAQHSPLYDLTQRDYLDVHSGNSKADVLQHKINQATMDFLSQLEAFNQERIGSNID